MTSNTMLCKSGECGHHFLVSVPLRNYFSSSLFAIHSNYGVRPLLFVPCTPNSLMLVTKNIKFF